MLFLMPESVPPIHSIFESGAVLFYPVPVIDTTVTAVSLSPEPLVVRTYSKVYRTYSTPVSVSSGLLYSYQQAWYTALEILLRSSGPANS